MAIKPVPLEEDAKVRDMLAAVYLVGTDRQKEYANAYKEHGGLRQAARALGLKDHKVIWKAFRICAVRAAREGHAPGHWNDGVAPGYLMGKVTVQRTKDGVERTWERMSPDLQAQIEAIKAGIEAFMEEVGPITVGPPPVDPQTDIIPWIQIGDAHLGMLAHEAETGENFDLKIAERELCAAIAILIDELAPSERIVINDLGDFTHYENFTATTEASGHALDFDSRFPRMIKVYSRVMRFIVDKALEKAANVDVIVNQGNHSRTNDIWMAEMLRVAYGPCGRVNVLNNDKVFIPYRMGNTFVITHHSDKCKPKNLAAVMTSDFRRHYGETEYHYVDIGHIHHGMVLKEHPDVVIESFNTLAPKDKWAHDGGWRSKASITVIFRSRTYGERGRRLLPIREVRDRIVAAMSAEGKAVYVPSEPEVFIA